jgi:hypothetical protein
MKARRLEVEDGEGGREGHRKCALITSLTTFETTPFPHMRLR